MLEIKMSKIKMSKIKMSKINFRVTGYEQFDF
jgi:hypothetical protein